jgi:hypothetical protein
VEILATLAIGITTYSKGDKKLVEYWWIYDEFLTKAVGGWHLHQLQAAVV